MQDMEEMQVWSLGREYSLEEEMVTHSTIPAWRIPWTEEPGGLQSMGWQRVRQDWAEAAVASMGTSPLCINTDSTMISFMAHSWVPKIRPNLQTLDSPWKHLVEYSQLLTSLLAKHPGISIYSHSGWKFHQLWGTRAKSLSSEGQKQAGWRSEVRG